MKKNGTTLAKAIMATLFVAVSILISSMSGSQSRDVNAERLEMQMVEGMQTETETEETEDETETETESDEVKETESEDFDAVDSLDAEEEEEIEESADKAAVGTWAEFQAALGNEEVHVIEFSADIKRPGTGVEHDLPVITRDLKIIGNDFSLIFDTGRATTGLTVFLLGGLSGSEEAVFEIENVKYDKSFTNSTARTIGLIHQNGSGNFDGWTVKIKNVRSAVDNKGGVATRATALCTTPSIDVIISGTDNNFLKANTDADIVQGKNIVLRSGSNVRAEKTVSAAGNIFSATEDIILEDNVIFEAVEKGTGDVLHAGRDIVLGEGIALDINTTGDAMKAGGTLEVRQNDYDSVITTGYLFSVDTLIIPSGLDLTITGKGSGGIFKANTMYIESGAKVETSYVSPSSNPSTYAVESLTIENGAELISKTDGAAYGFYGKDFILESGASADFEAAGNANAAMYITADGNVTAEPGSNLKIRNRDGGSKDEATSSGGIYGKAARFSVRSATVDILVNGWAFKSDASCTVDFTEGADVKLRSDNGMALGLYQATTAGGAASTYSNDNHVYISGNDTVAALVAGDTGVSAKGAAMYVRGKDATVEVVNGAVMTIRADSDVEIIDDEEDGPAEDDENSKANNNSALQIQGDGAVFKVHNGSVVKLSAAKSNKYTSPVLRFRYSGGMTLDIDNAELYVESDGGSASAIRLYGSNNEINVKNGGYLYVKNPGDKTPHNGPPSNTSNKGNAAIHFAGPSKGINTFYLDDENSTVEVIAESGPALYATNSQDTKITAGPGTVFEAYGHTKNSTSAIFNTKGELIINIDQPEYFDFKNGNYGQPAINASDASSKFHASETAYSIWRVGNDWNLSPTLSMGRVTLLEMSGKNYQNISNASDAWAVEKLKADNYSSILNYNRLSSNNARIIVDEIRIPTDADQFIYGHMSVPEGIKGAKRDAWDGEGHVLAEVMEDGQSRYGVLKGTTQRRDVYQQGNERSGIFEIALPEGEFLKAGQVIRIVGAWRGEDAANLEEAENNVNNVISTANDIKVSDQSVQKVVPPTALGLDNITAGLLGISSEDGETVLQNGIGTISGSSEEIGAAVYVYVNGVLVNDGTDLVEEDGKWIVRLDESARLEDGDTVFIALNDGQASANLEPEDRTYLQQYTINNNGNQNPSDDVDFHNTTFEKGLGLRVEGTGEITLVVPDYLDFGSYSVGIFDKMHKVQNINTGEFGVSNTRGTDTEWSLYVTVDKEFTSIQNPNIRMKDALIYKSNGEEIILGEGVAANVLDAQHSQNEEFYDIYDREWYNGSSGDGLYLKTKAGVGVGGEYEAQLTWSLMNIPGNE